MSNERVLPNQYGVMARLRATSGIEMDIGATKDPCGILEGKNGNLPKFMKGLQTGLLALEKGLFFTASTDQLISNQEQINRLGELSSFLHRVLFLDPNENPGENVARYALDRSVRLYLPDIPEKHNTEIKPPEKYDYMVPATVSLSIRDQKAKKILRIGTMPVLYSHYKKHADLAGATHGEAKQILHQRRRTNHRGSEIAHSILEHASKTIEVPHFFIQLEDEASHTTLECIRGDLSTKGDNIGLNLTSSLNPDVHAYMSLNLISKQNTTVKKVSPAENQLIILSNTLLTTELKSQQSLRRIYSD